MSYRESVIEFLQEYANENIEIREILERFHESRQESKKVNVELEERKSERQLMQMELFGLELNDDGTDTINAREGHHREGGGEGCRDAILEYAWRLKSCVQRIDFEVVFQCHIMKIESNARQEREQLEKSIMMETNWRQQMANRSIVKGYRQAERQSNELQKDFQEFQVSIKLLFNENNRLIGATMDERNALVCALIEGSKRIEQIRKELRNIQNFKLEFNQLQERKCELGKTLRRFDVSSCITNNDDEINAGANIRDNLNVMNTTLFYQIKLPKFPSFNELLLPVALDGTAKDRIQLQTQSQLLDKEMLLHSNGRTGELDSDTQTLEEEQHPLQLERNNKKKTRRVHFRSPPEEQIFYYSKDSSIEMMEETSGLAMGEQHTERQENPEEEEALQQEIGTRGSSTSSSFPCSSSSSSTRGKHIEILECKILRNPILQYEQEQEQEQQQEQKEKGGKEVSVEIVEQERDAKIEKDALLKPSKRISQIPISPKIKSFEEYMALNKAFIFSGLGSTDSMDLKDFDQESPIGDTSPENPENSFYNRNNDFSMELSDDSKSPLIGDDFL